MIHCGFAQNIGTREEQQDFFGFSQFENDDFVLHGGSLGIVCDGMGGLQNGKEAARCAVGAFLEAYAAKDPAESIPDALYRAVHFANDRVLAMARRLGQEENCGSTLVAAALHNKSLYWISVGDSHIYLCRGRVLELLNEEHTCANKLQIAVRQCLISEEDAAAHPDREALTSYIGIPRLTEISSGSQEGNIFSGNGVFLCSDGLSKVLTSEEMTDVFDPSPNQWAERLVENALNKKKIHQDNITVILMLSEDTVKTAEIPPLTKRRKTRGTPLIQKKTLKAKIIFVVVLLLLAVIGALTFNRNLPPGENAPPAGLESIASEDIAAPLSEPDGSEPTSETENIGSGDV
jgi:protein phosphatase